MMVLRSTGTMALSVALLSLVLWGCDSAGPSQSKADLSATLEQEQYTLNPDAQVRIRFVNTSARTLYLPVCGPNLTFVVERLAGGAWKNDRAGLCRAVYAMGYRRSAEPGDAFQVTPRIEEKGLYRVRLLYKTSRDAEETKSVRSEAFLVRASP